MKTIAALLLSLPFLAEAQQSRVQQILAEAEARQAGKATDPLAAPGAPADPFAPDPRFKDLPQSSDPFAPGGPSSSDFKRADPFGADPFTDLTRHKDRLKAASAAADRMPEGPDKEAVKDVIADHATLMIERINAMKTDYTIRPFSSIGPECELKKAQVEEALKTNASLPSDHIPLRDGRKVAVSSITLLTPASLRWIGEKLEETPWSEIDPRLIHVFGWSDQKQRLYEQWKKEATATAAAKASVERARAVEVANKMSASTRPVLNAPAALRGDIAAAIEARALKEYPTDYSMQEYVRKKQRAAVDTLRGYVTTGAVGVPKDVMSEIIQRAAVKWETDYSMMVYEIEREVEAYRR